MVKSRTAQTDAFERAFSVWVAKFYTVILQAIREQRSSISIKRLEDAIRSGSYARVMQIATELNLADTKAAQDIDRIFMDTFREGAGVAASTVSGVAIGVSFDILDPNAVAFMRRHKAAFVTEVNEETRRAIAAIVERSLMEGGGIPKQARKIHEVIGLTEKQALAVDNFRRQLEEQRNFANLTPAHLRRMSASERSRVKRHMRTGYLAQQQIDKLVETYRSRLERLRAKTIARTETMRALNEGQEEQWRQAIMRGDLDPNGLRRIWVTAGDSRVRDSHADIPRLNPNGVPFGTPFDSPNGPILMPPPFWSPWNCRCRVVLTEAKTNNPPSSL